MTGDAQPTVADLRRAAARSRRIPEWLRDLLCRLECDLEDHHVARLDPTMRFDSDAAYDAYVQSMAGRRSDAHQELRAYLYGEVPDGHQQAS